MIPTLPVPDAVRPLDEAGPALYYRVDWPGRGPVQVQILELFEQLREMWSNLPQVVEFVHEIMPWEEIDDNDKIEQAKFLTLFVKRHVRYVRDPGGNEYVRHPYRRHIRSIIERGVSSGDCDDHAMFLNVLLGAIGIETRFVGVKLRSKRFNHVISSMKLKDEDGVERWIEVDPCANKRPERTRKIDYPEQLTVKQ